MSNRGIALVCCAALLTMGGCAEEPSVGLVKEFENTETVTLSFFGPSTGSTVWSKPFTAEDGTEIQVLEDASVYYGQSGSGSDYRDMLTTRLRDEPDSVDFYVINAEDVLSFEQNGYWKDLSDMNAVHNLSQDALEQSTYDDKVFSIPLTYTGFGLYWNVDMLHEYGLEVPTNLDEFLHVCETLKSNGITPYLGNKGFALTVPAMVVGFAELYASDDRDALLEDLSNGTTPVSTYMEKGFAFIEMMAEKGYLDAEYSLATVPREADLQDFCAGKGASFCLSLGADLSAADFKIATTGFPVLPNGTAAVVGANNRVAINPKSANESYAREAVEFICSPENLESIARENGELPALAGASDTSYLASYESGLVADIQKGHQIPNQDFRLRFNTWESIRNLCRDVLAGTSGAEAARLYDQLQQEEIGG